MRVVRGVQKQASLLQKAETASCLRELSSSLFTRREVVHSDESILAGCQFDFEHMGNAGLASRQEPPGVILWRNKNASEEKLCLRLYQSRQF
jgi:hypothetical protein